MKSSMQKIHKLRTANRHSLWILLIVAIFIFIATGKTKAQEQNTLSSLWIDVSMGPPLLDLFNQSALSDDIARVEHISQLDFLNDVTTGKKLVVFKSAEDAIRLLPHIYEEFDIVGYNLEHGPTNPIDEQEDPVGSIIRLREAVDEYGLELALGPDHRFAESDAAAMAPYADYLILQVQKIQTEPQTVYDFVLPIVRDAREANPDLQVSVQIRTEGDVDELLKMLAPMQDDIDGISILTSEETIEISEELMASLRERTEQPAPENILENLVVEDRENVETEQEKTPIGEELEPGDNAPLATMVASVLENPELDDSDDILSARSTGNTLSTAEANQRAGSTWLFVVVALVAGIALGAGYISYRTGS